MQVAYVYLFIYVQLESSTMKDVSGETVRGKGGREWELNAHL